MTFSFPTRGVFVALTLAFLGLMAACGDDDEPSTCGNSKVDNGEVCDKANVNSRDCAFATSGAMPNGTLKCKSNCKQFDTSGCTAGGGGSGGSGGASG